MSEKKRKEKEKASGRKESLEASGKQEHPETLEEFLEDLKASNIKKDRKEFYYQLIKNLCEVQAKSTIEAIKYKKITNELEETIKQLQGQFDNSQNKESSEGSENNNTILNTMNNSMFRSGLNRSLPALPLYQTK